MNAKAQAIWSALIQAAEETKTRHLRQLFAEDTQRFKLFSRQHEGLLIDFSKQLITKSNLGLLHRYAHAMEFSNWQKAMLAGVVLNNTEKRAVRHMDLRAGTSAPSEVQQVLQQVENFCDAIHDGTWRGFSGERITDVVNIGIGGSDLGARMALRALSAYQYPDLHVHFVANVDGADLAVKLAPLNPRTTLFIVASKTFTTAETMRNALSARAWLSAAGCSEAAIARHFVAVSCNKDKTTAFGIAPENVFEFWDWVGGRFSLWSAIGLPLALGIGYRQFTQLLAGARSMDLHFLHSEPENNLPLILALLTLWNTNFLGAQVHAILPYSQSFALFPAYLQQLEMESNGKQVNRDGQTIDYATSPIVWGEAGTNGQHSFYQLIHQGGRLMPSDFVLLAEPDYPLSGHHQQVIANALAQTAALAFGQTAEEAITAGTPAELVPFKVFPGNQPSTTIVLPRLNPYVLGQFLAMYEHKVFSLGVLWHLNAFDQWGVELGKTLANGLLPVLNGEKRLDEMTHLDGSSVGLLQILLPNLRH